MTQPSRWTLKRIALHLIWFLPLATCSSATLIVYNNICWVDPNPLQKIVDRGGLDFETVGEDCDLVVHSAEAYVYVSETGKREKTQLVQYDWDGVRDPPVIEVTDEEISIGLRDTRSVVAVDHWMNRRVRYYLREDKCVHQRREIVNRGGLDFLIDWFDCDEPKSSSPMLVAVSETGKRRFDDLVAYSGRDLPIIEVTDEEISIGLQHIAPHALDHWENRQVQNRRVRFYQVGQPPR